MRRAYVVLLVLGIVACGKRPIADRDAGAGGAPAGTGGSAGSNTGAGAVGAAGASGSAGSNGGNAVAGSSGGGAAAGSTGGATAGTGGASASAGTGGAVAGTGGASAGTGGANAGAGPLRLLIFYTPWGTSYPEWWPTGSDRDFTMSPMMQALEPYKSDLIVVSGLTNARWSTLGAGDVAAAFANETNGDARSTLLTAGPPFGNPAGGPSLDTAVGDCGGAAGPPLRLAVGQYGFDDTYGVSFTGDGSPIHGEPDPHAVAMRVLGHDVSAPDPTGDINAIYPAIGAAHMSVAVEALATAKTCAVTLMWGDHFNPAVLGITGSDLHELSHDTLGLYEAVNGGPGAGRPDNRFAKMQRWYAQQFASLLDRLRATPLGPGTLLDQSVVLWISESGAGVDHAGFYIPVVIAGGGGGRLDVGRFIEIKPHLRSNGGFVDTTTIERTQGDLLQALASLWGMTSFGDPRLARQTLTQILKP